MQFICTQSWVPVRSEASSASEMVSSLLFGETCSLIEEKGEWINVSCNHDEYKGWIPLSYLRPASVIFTEWIRKVAVHGAVMQNSTGRIDLSPGSIIPNDLECNLSGSDFRYSDARAFEPENADAAGLSMLFLHTPYLWGGRSVWGIDCSGLVQVVFGILDKKLPRDASQQANEGNKVSYSEKKSGDLAFFEKDGKITHVGIVLSDNHIIHASGKVRIDFLTEAGIKNSETGQNTHALSCIKRV
ncbi:MAG: NlpC/P60 family protein [Sphingomonadales bacterium]|nr:NlpC/P60 family protein [Sphingomonadales bacterium]